MRTPKKEVNPCWATAIALVVVMFRRPTTLHPPTLAEAPTTQQIEKEISYEAFGRQLCINRKQKAATKLVQQSHKFMAACPHFFVLRSFIVFRITDREHR